MKLPPEIFTAHHLRVRGGQPGYVVIETTDHEPRISFLFDREQAVDAGERMILLANGATPSRTKGK